MARTKTVFGSHSNTAHVWAQNNYKEGRSSDRRIFFHDGTIFSYGHHFPIAKFHNKDVVFLTSQSHSISTSKHIGHVRDSISHRTVIVVPDVLASKKKDHEKNLEYFRQEYKKEFARLYRAQQWDHRWNDPIQKLSAIRLCWFEYRDAIGWKQQWKTLKADITKTEPSFDIDKDADFIYRVRAAREEKRNAPDYREKRDAQNEKARARAEFKRQFDSDYREAHRENERLIFTSDGKIYCTLSDFWEAEEDNEYALFTNDGKFYCDMRAIREAEKEDDDIIWHAGKRYATNMEYADAERDNRVYLWLDGENFSYFYHTKENGSVVLRVKGDELQTSRGASVPLEHAVRAFKTIIECKKQNRAWKTNGHTIHVGHFKIDSITPNGDIHAGCHFIDFEEIERIAKQLHLI